MDGRYIPDEYLNNPALRYNYYGNDYLTNAYRELYGENLDIDGIQSKILDELAEEKDAFEKRVRKNQEKVQSKKQGGTMNKIKYFAPGGSVSSG